MLIHSAGSVDSVPASSKPIDQRLMKACQGFEAIFLRQLLTTAQPENAATGLFAPEAGGSVLQDLRTTALADSLAQSGGFGIAGSLYESLSRHAGGVSSAAYRRVMEEAR
jgi:flagellar protein FlgJ